MSKPIHLIGLVAAAGLLLAACAQAAPPTPQVITKEVIKEVPKEVIKEVQVTKEVIKEVPKEVIKNVVKQTVVYNSNASDPKPRTPLDRSVHQQPRTPMCSLPSYKSLCMIELVGCAQKHSER